MMDLVLNGLALIQDQQVLKEPQVPQVLKELQVVLKVR
jgi:hypothetical protein